MEQIDWKYREYLTEERAEQTRRCHEAVRGGMSYEEAFDKFIETKLSPGEIRVLEEEDAIFESTGVRPILHQSPEELAETEAHYEEMGARLERDRIMPKYLYEIDPDNFTITKIDEGST